MNLNHPFALNISDLEDINLDIEEQLTDEEAAQISGGYKDGPISITLDIGATTLAIGEEGGYTPPGDIVCISAPCPGSETGGDPWPKPMPPMPPMPPVMTKALYENGGPIYW